MAGHVVRVTNTSGIFGYAAQIDLSTIEGLFIGKTVVPLLYILLPQLINVGSYSLGAALSPRAAASALPSSVNTSDWLVVWEDGTYDVYSDVNYNSMTIPV